MHPYPVFKGDGANSALGRKDVNVVTGSGKACRKISRKPTDAASRAGRVLVRNKANAEGPRLAC
jgi:hypothetical protein